MAAHVHRVVACVLFLLSLGTTAISDSPRKWKWQTFGECKSRLGATSSPSSSSPTNAPSETPDCQAICTGESSKECQNPTESNNCKTTVGCGLTFEDYGSCGGDLEDCDFALEEEFCNSPCTWTPSLVSYCKVQNSDGSGGGSGDSSLCSEYVTQDACKTKDTCEFILDGCSDCSLASRSDCIDATYCNWNDGAFSCEGSTGTDCNAIGQDGQSSDAEIKFLCENTKGCLFSTSGYCNNVIGGDGDDDLGGPTLRPPGSGEGSNNGNNGKCNELCDALEVSQSLIGGCNTSEAEACNAINGCSSTYGGYCNGNGQTTLWKPCYAQGLTESECDNDCSWDFAYTCVDTNTDSGPDGDRECAAYQLPLNSKAIAECGQTQQCDWAGPKPIPCEQRQNRSACLNVHAEEEYLNSPFTSSINDLACRWNTIDDNGQCHSCNDTCQESKKTCSSNSDNIEFFGCDKKYCDLTIASTDQIACSPLECEGYNTMFDNMDTKGDTMVDRPFLIATKCRNNGGCSLIQGSVDSFCYTNDRLPTCSQLGTSGDTGLCRSGVVDCVVGVLGEGCYDRGFQPTPAPTSTVSPTPLPTSYPTSTFPTIPPSATPTQSLPTTSPSKQPSVSLPTEAPTGTTSTQTLTTTSTNTISTTMDIGNQQSLPTNTGKGWAVVFDLKFTASDNWVNPDCVSGGCKQRRGFFEQAVRQAVATSVVPSGKASELVQQWGELTFKWNKHDERRRQRTRRGVLVKFTVAFTTESRPKVIAYQKNVTTNAATIVIDIQKSVNKITKLTGLEADFLQQPISGVDYVATSVVAAGFESGGFVSGDFTTTTTVTRTTLTVDLTTKPPKTNKPTMQPTLSTTQAPKVTTTKSDDGTENSKSSNGSNSGNDQVIILIVVIAILALLGPIIIYCLFKRQRQRAIDLTAMGNNAGKKTQVANPTFISETQDQQQQQQQQHQQQHQQQQQQSGGQQLHQQQQQQQSGQGKPQQQRVYQRGSNGQNQTQQQSDA